MDSSKKQTNGVTGTGRSSGRDDAIINTRNDDDDGSSSGGRSKGDSSVSTLSLSEGAGHGVAFEGEDVKRHGRSHHHHHSADPAGQGNNSHGAQHAAGGGGGSSIAATDESDDDRLRRNRPGQSSGTSVNSRGREYRGGEETRLEEGTRTPSRYNNNNKQQKHAIHAYSKPTQQLRCKLVVLTPHVHSAVYRPISLLLLLQAVFA